jgi:hypothetical protein
MTLPQENSRKAAMRTSTTIATLCLATNPTYDLLAHDDPDSISAQPTGP